MTKQIITQKTSDSTYYHPDFHIAFNYGIEYLHKNFGAEAVREYLMKFANAYYTPLKKALMDKGLLAIKEHYKKIYQIENAIFSFNISNNELLIHLSESPAVMYIKEKGHTVSPLFQETVTTVRESFVGIHPMNVSWWTITMRMELISYGFLKEKYDFMYRIYPCL